MELPAATSAAEMMMTMLGLPAEDQVALAMSMA